MKIGLVDVDGHNFPNLALMRISAYHKSIGDDVEWWQGNLIYYDKVYMSKIFSDAYSREKASPYNCGEVVRGGTGYAISLRGGGQRYMTRQRTHLCQTISSGCSPTTRYIHNSTLRLR